MMTHNTRPTEKETRFLMSLQHEWHLKNLQRQEKREKKDNVLFTMVCVCVYVSDGGVSGKKCKTSSVKHLF